MVIEQLCVDLTILDIQWPLLFFPETDFIAFVKERFHNVVEIDILGIFLQ